MNNLIQFNFNTEQIRVITIADEPWFVAKDLCIILSITNVSDALSRLDEDEKGVIGLTDSIGREQQMSVVSESGMLALILSSRKPEAKAFRKWVTSVLLPTIIRTGSYTAPALPTLPLTLQQPIPTQAIALCKNLLLEAGIESAITSSWILTQYAKYDLSGTAVYEDGKKLLASMSDSPGLLLSPTEIGILLADREGLPKALSAIAVNKPQSVARNEAIKLIKVFKFSAL